MVSRTFDILVLIFRRTKPSVQLAFPVIRSTCVFQDREPEISTPRYLAYLHIFGGVDLEFQYFWVFFCFRKISDVAYILIKVTAKMKMF